MTENKQDELARAYATLLSLQKNISRMKIEHVPEIYVNEYHTVLDRLEDVGIIVAGFRIPDSEVGPKNTDFFPSGRSIRGGSSGSSGSRGSLSYSKEKYVDKSFILTKLDAILGYFEIITSEKPSSIGFRTPDKK